MDCFIRINGMINIQLIQAFPYNQQNHPINGEVNALRLNADLAFHKYGPPHRCFTSLLFTILI